MHKFKQKFNLLREQILSEQILKTEVTNFSAVGHFKNVIFRRFINCSLCSVFIVDLHVFEILP
jgi:hypothetical protein